MSFSRPSLYPWLEVPDQEFLEDDDINYFINMMLSANLNLPDSPDKLRKLFASFVRDQQASASAEVQVKHLRDIAGVAPAEAESFEDYPHPNEAGVNAEYDPVPGGLNTYDYVRGEVKKTWEDHKYVAVPYSAFYGPFDGVNDNKNIKPNSFSTTLTPTPKEKSSEVQATKAITTKAGPDVVKKTFGSQQGDVLPIHSQPSVTERPFPPPRQIRITSAPTLRQNISSASAVATPLTSDQELLPAKTNNNCNDLSANRAHSYAPMSTSALNVAHPQISGQQLLPTKSINTCTDSSINCAYSVPASASSRKSRFTGVAAREKLRLQQMLNATK